LVKVGTKLKNIRLVMVTMILTAKWSGIAQETKIAICEKKKRKKFRLNKG